MLSVDPWERLWGTTFGPKEESVKIDQLITIRVNTTTNYRFTQVIKRGWVRCCNILAGKKDVVLPKMTKETQLCLLARWGCWCYRMDQKRGNRPTETFQIDGRVDSQPINNTHNKTSWSGLSISKKSEVVIQLRRLITRTSNSLNWSLIAHSARSVWSVFWGCLGAIEQLTGDWGRLLEKKA